MPLKLGDKAIKLPFSKACLGSVLIYQKESSNTITFDTCPFPIEWNVPSGVDVTAYTYYTADNEYGNWIITATSRYGSDYRVSNAFDGDSASAYRTATLGTTDKMEVVIESPVEIKPNSIEITYAYFGSESVIEGYNSKTGVWENICALTSSGSATTSNIDNIETNNFYTKFRVCTNRYGSRNTTPYLYEFQITSGEIKEA